MEEICQFLHEAVPGIEVTIKDDLCHLEKTDVIGDKNHRVIFGACSEIAPKYDIWHEATDACIDLNSTKVVDLLKLISTTVNEIEMTHKIKLLLLAQIKRLIAAKGSSPSNYDIRFFIPKTMVNRRQFLKAALPRYELKPHIEPSKCTTGIKCQLCLDVCSSHAIICQKDQKGIDTNVCSGCGACMVICPNEAIAYPAYSAEELGRELEGLLYGENECLNPRIITFSCMNYLPDYEGDSKQEFTYSSNILPIEVPCLSAVSPWLMLRAFELGAQGLVFFANEDKCSSESCPSALENNVRFVQSVLDCMNIEKTRMKVLKITHSNQTNTESELNAATVELARLKLTPFKYDHQIVLADNMTGIHALIDRMGKRLSYFKKGTIDTSGVSLGQITIDSNKCTDCGLCVLNCPANALTECMIDDGESHLLFHYESCIACGMCLNICPEKCIELRHILELDKICGQELKLVKTDVEYCSSCGVAVAPKVMLDSLAVKLREAGCSDVHLNLCPQCRVGSTIGEQIEIPVNNSQETVSTGMDKQNQDKLIRIL
jgi:Pyruvate/2-oxoacid:ferredoxin oxidoreductase delta subunit/coenzyme F420-reducing hydrogenase delta subunit